MADMEILEWPKTRVLRCEILERLKREVAVGGLVLIFLILLGFVTIGPVGMIWIAIIWLGFVIVARAIAAVFRS